ncbi:MAG: DegT/DnrJ/EryC1/StrS family aminotransferase [Methylococcales bacterium]|nr:DegT/DnrJ/EryC1/StrS family aminotransferase [Methylococcales bacterium]
MNEKIYYTKPSITEKEIEYATDAARNGWGDRCYEYINRFEQGFKQHLAVNHAIATSSCTGAMHIGLAALGVGLGDEVILADTNWIATAAPITYLSATPVFVDILPDTWCIDPVQAEAAITSKTKAIIATHLYGNLCDMDALIALGNKYGIPIIEDAAEAIGSVYKGKRAGSMGMFGVFSFHGTKTLTTGEGGMFVTNNSELYETVLTLNNHGRSRNQTKQFWPDMIGFKYKMSNIQAAIGCAQMERIESLINRKREIFSFYADNLQQFNKIHLNPEKKNTLNGYWMPTVVFDKKTQITREILIDVFSKENIDARVFFYPLSSLSMFTPVANYNSYDIPTRAINLPSYDEMTKENQISIIDCIKKIINE